MIFALLAATTLAAASPESMHFGRIAAIRRPRPLPCAEPVVDTLWRADTVAIDSLRSALRAKDSLQRLDSIHLAGARDSLLRLRTALDLGRASHLADSATLRRLSDSILLFHRVDTLALHIDSVAISDSDLASDVQRLVDLVNEAALSQGYSISRRPLVAGIRNSTPLRIALGRTKDSVWVRLELGGRIAQEGIHLALADRAGFRNADEIARMNSRAVRTLFGATSLPPEPKGPWPTGVRAGIVVSAMLVSLLVVIGLQ